MADPAKQPGVYARAEAGSRQFILLVGAGITAFVVGTFVSNGILSRLVERGVGFESDSAAVVVMWILMRLWLFLALPGFAWLAGRFMEVDSWRFAFVSAIAGETFSALVTFAWQGMEWIFPSVLDGVIRVGTLALGIVLVERVVRLGHAAARRADVEAQQQAEATKAEYAEFLRRAGAEDVAPAAGQPDPAGGSADAAKSVDAAAADGPGDDAAKPAP